jgi:very-short-patch-repair endonuclease
MMAGGMDLALLRQLVGGVLDDLAGLWKHLDIGAECEGLGLPTPPPADECSKRERVRRSLAALADADLPRVAERIVTGTMPLSSGPAARYAIEDVLWAGQGSLEIPKRTRREIAQNLDLAGLAFKPDRFIALLDRLWVLDTAFDLWTEGSTGLRTQIDRHVFRNPGDWSAEDLFEELGAFEAGDARFGNFLEGLASADVIPSEPAQRQVVAAVNSRLRSAAAELRETSTDGGYPVFSLVSTRPGRARRPKNLIFASLAKPDIRFADAVDNDIEIVENADKVLVYDRPIGRDGLRWVDLQAWWKDIQHLADDDEAKRSLYQRLARSLPANSPPQRNLFDLYHEIHASAVPGLPALLPEVWLHWDPKTVRARGLKAMLEFRMDFLILPPHGHRIVLEVDGSHHFTGEDGRPNPATYAAGVRGDRDLKLSGYEVFRFGASELQDAGQAHTLLRQFFADLFRRFGVTSPAN